MSYDPNQIESDLRRMCPAELDEALLARLDSCAQGTWKELDPAEVAFGKRLAGIGPAPLSAALTESLESLLSGVAFPKDGNIVPFPQQEVAPEPKRQRGWWSAAAVVALTGALSAFLVPTEKGPSQVAKLPSDRPVLSNSAAEKLVPAGFRSGLQEARDEGVVWQQNQPHRVLRVVYNERVTWKDAQGRTVELEQPRVEYILVPSKTD